MKTLDDILHDNLLTAIEIAGGNKKLARMTGLRACYISQLKARAPAASGKPRSIGKEAMEKIERALHKPVGWMSRDHSEETDKISCDQAAVEETESGGQTIEMNSDIAANNGKVQIQSVDLNAFYKGKVIDLEAVRGWICLDREWLENNGVNPDSLTLLRMTGYSMEPCIKRGDAMIIDSSDTEVLATFPQIFMVYLDGEVSVQRVIRSRLSQTAYHLTSDNKNGQSFPGLTIDTSNRDDLLAKTFQVIGRVIWHGGKL